MRGSKPFIFAAVIAVFVMLLTVVQSNTSNAQPSGVLPSQQPSPQASPRPVVTKQHSYFDATAKWPSAKIYVCWENPTEANKAGRDLVRQAVASSWEAASAVRFTGWQQCARENRGIRILIQDVGARTLGLGVYLDGQQNGMVLNFTFNNWSRSCRQDWAACMKSIAVHEFGHALGFAHEHNRPDTPGECDEERQGSDGTVLLTPYDPDSVMNYCNKKYNNNGVLSKYDTEAVRKIYGMTMPNRSRSRPRR